MAEFILYVIYVIIINILINYIYNKIKYKNNKTGIIKVDHKSGSCKIMVCSDDLLDINTKKVFFVVEHDGDFSREEQSI